VILQLLAVVVLGLMCGSELNVAAFAHPILRREPLEVHVPVRASLAALLGRVMPFWMAGSTLLNLLLLLPFEHIALQALAVVFSLVGPVPINKRIIDWKPSSLPTDWEVQENRWDLYHWIRTCGLIVAFALLVISVKVC
jgi:Anthrone oxygenase